jgi:hypothetical protein
MMKTAPLNSSISVSLRLSVVSTPQRSYELSAKMKLFIMHVTSKEPYW